MICLGQDMSKGTSEGQRRNSIDEILFQDNSISQPIIRLCFDRVGFVNLDLSRMLMEDRTGRNSSPAPYPKKKKKAKYRQFPQPTTREKGM